MSTETQPGLLVPDGLSDGAVRRVAETGQSLIQVSATEPAIRNLPAALAAVPLVGGGRVEALLIVHGHPAGDAFLKGITNLLSEAVRPASQTPCGPRHPSASRAHGRRR